MPALEVAMSVAYAALMTDEYSPFRLSMGGDDSAEAGAAVRPTA
jgi:hypothetical protein